MFGKKIEVGHYCPLLKKECIEHKCAWYTHIRGSNPNTGEDLDNDVPLLDTTYYRNGTKVTPNRCGS